MAPVVRHVRHACCAAATLLLLAPGPATAQMPDPLSLEAALDLADVAHPSLARSEAQLDLARAEGVLADAENDLDVYISGRLQWVEPNSGLPVNPYDQHDDNAISLFAVKPLYDGGRSASLRSSSDHRVAGREWAHLDARQQHRITVMSRFFDVLLADLQYSRDDEALAVSFVRFDKARERNALGQVSDIEVLRLESEFQTARRVRFASGSNRRAARSRLALALGRPGDLPSTLIEPELPDIERELPPLEELERLALEQNPQLAALAGEVAAARENIEAARALARPRVTAEVEFSEYSRDTATRDDIRAGVHVEIPLYRGARTDGEVARAQAQFREEQARLDQKAHEIRQAVMDTWFSIDDLKRQGEEAAVLEDYRDLYLDRSRARYELDLETSLGDAMAQSSAARLFAAETRYRLALAWARLDALTGSLIEGSVEQR